MSIKSVLHLGGFATPLPCNGSSGGYTTKNVREVTCKNCLKMIQNGTLKHRNGRAV